MVHQQQQVHPGMPQQQQQQVHPGMPQQQQQQPGMGMPNPNLTPHFPPRC